MNHEAIATSGSRARATSDEARAKSDHAPDTVAPDTMMAPDASPDSADRVKDFLARHGGAGANASTRATDASGLSGFSEVHAADGYTLRCEWSRTGQREEMKFSEVPPRARDQAARDSA